MTYYRVFGEILSTSLAFPELRPCRPDEIGAISWQFELADHVEVGGEVKPLGTEQLVAGTFARLGRSSAGAYVLSFDDTGTFLVSPDGSRIWWRVPDPNRLELGRLDFLGRVLAVAAHARGQLCLHGSAVALPHGEAIGFLAPKGFGKSTLALELVSQGARLLTDDTLPVFPETGKAGPGVHSVRLRDDVLGRHGTMGRQRLSLGEKTVVEDLPDAALENQRVPLAALYILVPSAPSVEPGREVLPSPLAALALIQYAKLGALLGGPAAVEVLARAAAVASRTRVYRLFVPRDLAHLPAVAAALHRWSERDRSLSAGGA